ncbi:hypothetical protein [Siminovitchia terrae]|uniref:hypothetical protein n=1 Tax=Siminovitchia terrae TaxID=1914933 RepID=UPI001B032266|nr:hypothetical protein [Siminovitchia terrae]GIN90243.1 hypothetical protein J22TS1_12940 [Siminovitchia terrae]
MKKYFQWKNIIIGKIDKNHPQSEEINKSLDKNFTSVSKMINEITSFTDCKRNQP